MVIVRRGERIESAKGRCRSRTDRAPSRVTRYESRVGRQVIRTVTDSAWPGRIGA